MKQYDEEFWEDMQRKAEPEYCLTEIPKDLAGFSLIETHEVYDEDYWKMVAKQINTEHERYVKQCEAMQIDPESGRSTMSWEELNRPFTM